MNKKSIISFSITLTSLLLILTGSIVAFFIIKPYDKGPVKEISAELKAAKEVFKLKLDTKANEYYILGINSGQEKKKTVTIPESIDGIPVTKLIGEDDFTSYRFLSNITITKNIKYIGIFENDNYYYRYPFLNATGLSNIYVDEENKYFESVDGVLYSKDLKTLLRFPNGKSFNLGYISYTLPDHTEVIAPRAFYLNDMIEEVNLNDNLIEIGSNAFFKCEKLSDVNFNEKIEIIGDNAFDGCGSLYSITLPGSLKQVGKSLFARCRKLRNITIECYKIDFTDSKIFTGITNISETWTVIITIPEDDSTDYDEILTNKFSDLEYVKSLGLTGLDVKYERFIVLNGLYGVVDNETKTIQYVENKPLS